MLQQGGRILSRQQGVMYSARNHTHYIRLRPDCDKPVDMFADWDQHFTRHMTTFFRPRSLVFDVDSCSSFLNEQLRQFHDGRESTVTSIGICNDGSQEVGPCNPTPLLLWSGNALLTLFTIVKELRHEQVLHFVGYCVLVLCQNRPTDTSTTTDHRVIGEIWGRLVRRGSSGRTLPARHVDCVEILGHLREHRWFQASICEARILVLQGVRVLLFRL